MRLAVILLLLAGCTYTRTYDTSGHLLEETLSPGIATPETPSEGRQRIQGVGVLWTGRAAVLGYYSADTARLGTCGLIIITDHPERVDPALHRPC
jgi:hypothetical protein